MSRRRAIPAVILVALALGALLWLRRGGDAVHYTGFVEGEERVIRSSVTGRVLEMRHREGDAVPAGAVIAVLDTSEVDARSASKQRELAVLEAQIRRQEEQVALVETTWRRDVEARGAALREAEAHARLGVQTWRRTERLHRDGVVSLQRLDEANAQRDASESSSAQARDMLARARAQEGEIALARHQLDVLHEQLALARAQLGELEVLRAKHGLRAPEVDTLVQAQLLWPGELAQPGTPVLSLLDPRDKYVQIYVPVADLERVTPGRRVEIELDSTPGRRVPGEIAFVADAANFTPEKIETRSDRLGQVVRAKVRILEDVERFPPGAEGDVYLVEDDQAPAARTAQGTP